MGVEGRRRTARSTAAGLLGLSLVAIANAQPVPQGSPIPRVAPSAPVPTAPPELPAPLAPPTALPALNAVVTAVEIDGVTAYPEARLRALASGLVGDHTPLREIESVRRAILLLYRNDGYPFVVVSARLDRQGRLRFAVSEGYIADVKLAGDVGPVGSLVLRFLSHLTEQRPINNATIEHWVLLAQTIPGVQIQPILQPSEREPGAFTMVARLSVKAVSGELAADNDAFPKGGPNEGLLTLGVNSRTALGERTEAAMFLAGPNGRQIFGQASEQFFLGGSGVSVRLYGGSGQTVPCCDLAVIGYDLNTIVYGTQISYPVLLSRQQQLYLRASFDALDFGDDGAGRTGEWRQPAGAAAVRRLCALRHRAWPEACRQQHGFRALLSGAALARRLGRGPLRRRAARRADRLQQGRCGNHPRPDAVHLCRGSAPVAVRAGRRAKTADVLPSAEEFYLGGLRYTRGFYSGEVEGDNGLALTAELRLTSSFSAELLGNPVHVTPQFFAFYDWGATWQNQASDANQTLRSFGVGVRSGITPFVNVELEGVHRLTRQVGGTNVAPEAANAVYWRVVTTF